MENSTTKNECCSVDEIIENIKRKLTIIFLIQTILFVSALIILFGVNIFSWTVVISKNRIIFNSALFGYLGSLVYFSRKSYVYLITKKFQRIIDSHDVKISSEILSIKSIIRGYCLYLLFRPLVGLIIGPILYMLSMTGLITFMKKTVESYAELSQSGRYFIYTVSFLGGHASSDVLDRFSKIAKKITVKSVE